MRRRHLLGLAAVGALIALGRPAEADSSTTDQPTNRPSTPARSATGKTKPNNQPAVVTADRLIYDRDLFTITASGHVEVDQAGRILLADAVSYNTKQDVIIATGNVSVTDIDGEVRFADYIELSGDFKQAVARDLRLLMVDNSRFAAAIGRRTNGDRNVLDNAIYSPCQACAEDPDGPPLWDIRAKRIVSDEVTHQISYTDAWFDVEGVPVAYTPYFSHADATIKRESGLLPPRFFSNRIIGNGFRLPYYQIIDDNEDALIEPMYTSHEGPGMLGTWRARFDSGEMDTSASVANEPETNNPSATTTGWSVNAKSEFALDDTWRAGYDIERTSDRDYLRYYNYTLNTPYLTSRPYVEGFSERDYASVEAYSFQNQSDVIVLSPPNVPDKTATVLPLITYSAQSVPGWMGGYWTFDTHSASIMRGDDETDSRQLNTLTAWHVPYTSVDGQVYHFTTSFQADAYNSDNIFGLPPGSTTSANAFRAVPAASVDWRYPFTKVGDHSSQTVTPIIMVNVEPYGNNSIKIPNEDSLDLEVDDSNIFDADPFTGYDRVASGPRVAYGWEYTITDRGSSAGDFLIAQSYEPHPATVYPVSSGLDTTLSDVVGRVQIVPSPDLVGSYHFRLDEDGLGIRRNEIDLSAGPRPLNVQVGYILDNLPSLPSPYNRSDQVTATVNAQINRYWSVQAFDYFDLGTGGGPLQIGSRLRYEDECTALELDSGKMYTTVNTLVSGVYVVLQVELKTLAQFPISLF